MNGPVLVTGATGFLGREIATQLVRSGVETHAFARAGSDRGPLAALPIRWHAGDLRDPESIDRAASALAAAGRADARPRVIHAAALISYRTRDRADALEINVEGTRRLIDAARRHGLVRIAYVSSVVTVGSAEGADPVDETAAFNLGGLGVHYVDTKRAAEQMALAAADLDVVVVNPGAIFGPVERSSNTMRLIRRMSQGRSPPFAPPGTISVVGVHDAARGTILALEKGRRGERYLLVESSIATVELFARIASRLGVPPVTRVVPRAAWRILTALSAPLDLVVPMQATPPQALRMLGQDLRLDGSKARRELGWSPRPFDEVLDETIAHLRSKGLLEIPARS